MLKREGEKEVFEDENGINLYHTHVPFEHSMQFSYRLGRSSLTHGIIIKSIEKV